MEAIDLSGGAAKKIRARKKRFFSVAKTIMLFKASSRRVQKDAQKDQQQDEQVLDATDFGGSPDSKI